MSRTLITFKKVSKTYNDVLKYPLHELHFNQQIDMIVYLDRAISSNDNHIKVILVKSALALVCMSIDLDGRTLESALTKNEMTGYRVGTVVVFGTAVSIRLMR